MFVWGIIFLILAIVAVALAFTVGTKTRTVTEKVSDYYSNSGYKDREVTRNGTRKWFFLSAGFFAALAVLFTIFASTFSVENGSSTVLKNWGGGIEENAVTTAGIHAKAPWQDDIAWNIKNQDTTFTGNGTTTHNGQPVSGAEITIIDKDGISANMDIQVLFSIKADSVVSLTKGYTNQDDFEIKVVENDVKSIPRDVASTFTTVQMFEERTRLKAEITEALSKAWADKGVIVDNVNLHGIRYPEDVQQRFKDAQNAQTDLLKAQTEAQTAKATATGEKDAAIERANGEAEANRLIAASLTPQVLQQRYIDALSKASTIVVPNNFTSLGQLPAPAQ
jgi:regulator of protease activity HflC (stomatin/prohibitin superfamily)